MQGYPIFFRAVKEMGPKALLTKRQATAIARKAGVRQGGLADGGADIAGTFSAIDSENGFEVTAGDFPGAGKMDRDMDLTGYSEGRVLVNVSEAGSGTLGVSGAVDASASLTSIGINLSGWEPIDGSSWSWVSTGGATIGLAQLQVR